VAEAESDDRIDVFIGDLGGFPVSGGGAGGTTTVDRSAKRGESEHRKEERGQGATPPKERTSIVRTFNNSGKILLLSTKAGGVGLNLVGANRLVLVDSSWNPAHDLQAQARGGREGQTKPCSI